MCIFKSIFNRIRVHLYIFLKSLHIKLDKKKYKRVLTEFETACNEITPEQFAKIESELESMAKEHRDAEPKLNPRRTMLFQSRQGEHRCNYITASVYRQRIIEVLRWARERGITTFIADYTTPLGLLALETMVKLREAGEDFHVYAFKGGFISQRKSYRLIAETDMELIYLCMQADYDYYDLTPQKAVHIVSSVATICSEVGIWVAKEKIPPYLLEAWDS